MARILLIDDEDSFRSMLTIALTDAGHAVTEARNGKEGLELFEQLKPDLIVTDLFMPETEGLEVLQQLWKREPPVKIIVMSGGWDNRAGYLQAAGFLGAGRVLAKPFANRVLLAAIDEVLADKGPPAPAGKEPPPPRLGR